MRVARNCLVELRDNDFRKFLWSPFSGYPARPQTPISLSQYGQALVLQRIEKHTSCRLENYTSDTLTNAFEKTC